MFNYNKNEPDPTLEGFEKISDNPVGICDLWIKMGSKKRYNWKRSSYQSDFIEEILESNDMGKKNFLFNKILPAVFHCRINNLIPTKYYGYDRFIMRPWTLHVLMIHGLWDIIKTIMEIIIIDPIRDEFLYLCQELCKASGSCGENLRRLDITWFYDYVGRTQSYNHVWKDIIINKGSEFFRWHLCLFFRDKMSEIISEEIIKKNLGHWIYDASRNNYNSFYELHLNIKDIIDKYSYQKYYDVYKSWHTNYYIGHQIIKILPQERIDVLKNMIIDLRYRTQEDSIFDIIKFTQSDLLEDSWIIFVQEINNIIEDILVEWYNNIDNYVFARKFMDDVTQIKFIRQIRILNSIEKIHVEQRLEEWKNKIIDDFGKKTVCRWFNHYDIDESYDMKNRIFGTSD